VAMIVDIDSTYKLRETW